MKWQNHKLCNAAIIYGITGSLKATILTTIGAVLPDVFELNSIIRHRTITHYPWFYIVPLIFIFPFRNESLYNIILYNIIIGCIIHLILDALSKSGIPYKHPYGNDKIALNLYTTHHVSEYYIAILITITFCMISRFNGYMYMNHFTNEITNMLTGNWLS